MTRAPLGGRQSSRGRVKMNTKAKLRSFVAKLLIITTTSACLTTQSYAGAISTEAALATDRERILVLLDRPDVSAQLEAYGVKPSDAKARVVGLAHALHRNRPHQRVVDLLAGFALAEKAAQDRRIGRTWANDIHRDSLARDFPCQRLGEGDDPAFARGVNRLARRANARSVG